MALRWSTLGAMFSNMHFGVTFSWNLTDLASDEGPVEHIRCLWGSPWDPVVRYFSGRRPAGAPKSPT